VVAIAVYGDDAMAGFTVNSMGMLSVVTPNEPADLQASLQSQFADTGISVQNNATGGGASSLKNELTGMDGGGPPTVQRLAATKAVLVIDNHAVNDALGGENVNDFTGFLGQWINAVRGAGKTPILEEPGPVCDGNHPQLGTYVQAMDDVAGQYGVPVIKQYAFIQTVPNWCSHMAGGFYPDSFIDGLKAQQELAVIGPLVKGIIATTP
jgi:hypothetical protein